MAAVVGQGSTLVAAALLSNLLGSTSFARYSVAVSTVLTLGALSQSGLSFTATNFVARYNHTDQAMVARINQVCLTLGVVSGIVAGITVAVFSRQIAQHVYRDVSLWPILLVAGFGVPAAAAGLVQIGIAAGLQRFVFIASCAAVFAIGLLACTVGGAILFGAVGGAFGYTVAVFLRAGFLGLGLRDTFIVTDGAPGLGSIRGQFISFALAAGVAGLTLTPAIWVTNALLVNRHGLRALGVFSAAFTLKTLIAFVPTQFGAVFLPRYVAAGAADASAAHRGLVKGIITVLLTSIALAAVVATFSEQLMRVFGVDFVMGETTLRWLSASVVLECTAVIWTYRLAGQMRMWISALVVTGPKDLLLVAAAVILVPRFGGEGLAIAHLVSWTYAIVALSILSVVNRSAQSAGSAVIS